MQIRRLRFLAIPKTAGSTFTDVLRRQYAGTAQFGFTGDAAQDHARFAALSKGEQARIGLFFGHMPITTGIPQADDATVITFLRDPIRRVVSFCQHVSEGKSGYLLEEFPPDQFDLDHFLESGKAELSNLQTKMLINHKYSTAPLPLGQISAAELRDAALDNLYGKVLICGLQEFFDESLLLFARVLHWSYPFYISTNRSNPAKKLKLKQRHIDRITELNQIDVEVYEAARKRFSSILADRQIGRTEVRAFRTVNRIGKILLRVYLRTPGVKK